MKKMSEAELYCWHYIQDHLSEIPSLTISKLAEQAHVSLSTVDRALKKMGYEGYSDLKHSIRNSKDEHRKNGFSKEVNQAIRKNEVEITRTINQLSVDDMEEAVKMLDSYKNIMIFATGLSFYVAQEMLSKLQLFGKNCASWDDLDYMKYHANKIDSRDTLLIAISMSGKTTEIADAIETAKRRKTKVLVLTASPQSRMAQLADVCLLAYSSRLKEIDFGLDVDSRIPLQIVCRILLDTYSIYKNLSPIREKETAEN